MSDRHDAAAREWLRARKDVNDKHGGLIPLRIWPANTLAASLAALLRSTAEQEREACAKVADLKIQSESDWTDEEIDVTCYSEKDMWTEHNVVARKIADAIRSRGAKGKSTP